MRISTQDELGTLVELLTDYNAEIETINDLRKLSPDVSLAAHIDAPCAPNTTYLITGAELIEVYTRRAEAKAKKLANKSIDVSLHGAPPSLATPVDYPYR